MNSAQLLIILIAKLNFSEFPTPSFIRLSSERKIHLVSKYMNSSRYRFTIIFITALRNLDLLVSGKSERKVVFMIPSFETLHRSRLLCVHYFRKFD